MNKHIVIDNGSGFVKAGFTGEQEGPQVTVPSVSGGKSALANGVVSNWEAMENIWQRVIEMELGARPEEHNVIVTEPMATPAVNRKKTAELFFEKFKVPALYIAKDTVMALYGTGTTSGLVLDIGEGVTSCVPIYEGAIVGKASTRVDFGGRHVTNFLSQLMEDRGQSLERMHVVGIKETLGAVAPALQLAFSPKDPLQDETYNFTKDIIGVGREIVQLVKTDFKLFDCGLGVVTPFGDGNLGFSVTYGLGEEDVYKVKRS
eukprot:gene16730-19884_t